MKIVTNLQNQLRDLPGYLGPAVTEGWLRRYQARAIIVDQFCYNTLTRTLGTSWPYASYDERFWLRRFHSTSTQDVRECVCLLFSYLTICV